MAKYYYAQNREDLLIKGFFPDVAAGTYVDVGANDPVLDSVTKMFYDAGWAGINIEPQTALFEALEAQRPRDLNLNIGIGAEPGVLLFTEFPEGNGLSTFDRTVVDRLQNVEKPYAARVAVERQVEVKTLGAVIRAAGLRHVHVMKIDVEGFEYEVLSGMDWTGVRPELICIEANKIDPARDWRAMLAALRYTKVFHDGLNDYWLAPESAYRQSYFNYPLAVFLDSPIYYPAAVALEKEIRGSVGREFPTEPVEATKPLHLIVDAQVLQSEARDRGMGRYVLSLIDALAVDDAHCTFLVNSDLPALDAQSRQVLERQGTVVELPLLHSRSGLSFAQAKEANRLSVSQAVAAASRTRPATKVVCVIPALFSRDAYSVFPAEAASNLAIFYDLIPYFFPEAYLRGDDARDYSERFSEFYRADHFACDSQSAADDLAVHLGVDPARITPILGASAFLPGQEPSQPAFARSLGRFALVACGYDARKNNEATVRAFAQLGPEITPVFTSTYPTSVQGYLQSICPRAVFAGRVSDPELLWLTDHAEFVFFPSLYEGLGLPILEAVERGTPVVCSRIPSFREISATAFRFFDPLSLESMTEALREATAAERQSTATQLPEYEAILSRFNWPSCAARFFDAANRTQRATRHGRLAMLAPSPATYSAIGKYALQTYAELSRHFQVDYFGETGDQHQVPARFNVLEHSGHYFPVSAFAERAPDYEHVLYHLGNGEFHATTALSAFAHPGAAIMHSTQLDAVLTKAVEAGMVPDGLRVQAAAVDAALGLQRSEGLAWIVTKQKLVATFSKFAEEAVAEIPGAGVAPVRVSQPVGLPSPAEPESPICTVGFAGVLTAGSGQLAVEIAALGDVAVKIFGFDPERLIGQFSPHENIRVRCNLSDLQFQRELHTSDIVVDYRRSYEGETSRSTLEAMAGGAAVVVRRVGWFDELPDDVVVKVEAEADVAPAVQALVHDPDRRARVGAAARAYLAEHHGYAAYAERLAASVRAASSPEAAGQSDRGDAAGVDSGSSSVAPDPVAQIRLASGQHLASGAPDRAQEVLDRGFERWGRRPELLVEAVVVAARTGALDRASDLCDEALRAEPGHAEARASRIALDVALGRRAPITEIAVGSDLTPVDGELHVVEPGAAGGDIQSSLTEVPFAAGSLQGVRVSQRLLDSLSAAERQRATAHLRALLAPGRSIAVVGLGDDTETTRPAKLGYGVCINDERRYRQYAVPALQAHITEGSSVIESRGNESIFSSYNAILDAFAGYESLAGVVLLREDVSILDPHFEEKIRQAFLDPDVAIVGVVGGVDVQGMAWWSGQGRGRCTNNGSGLIDYGGGSHDVEIVDGLLMALSPWAARNLRFDADRFDGFHGYNADLCFQARAAGKKVRVIDLPVFHHDQASDGDREAYRQSEAAFRSKWATVLGAGATRWNESATSGSAAVRGSRPSTSDAVRVLYIDDRIPNPDVGCGYGRSYDTLRALAERPGTNVTFHPGTPGGIGPAVEGVQIVENLVAHLNTPGADYDVVVVSRPHNVRGYGGFLDAKLPSAVKIYDAEALFFRRMERQVELIGGPERSRYVEALNAAKEQEASVLRWSDWVVCISETEAAIAAQLSGRPVRTVSPRLRNPSITGASFAQREGIGLVAGWAAGPGSPNVDGLRWFVTDVLPRVRERCPSAVLRVSGGNPPAEVVELRRSGSVEFVGLVPNIVDFYNSLRVAISPTRYGAGVNIKTVEAIQHGVPVVATESAAGGLNAALRSAVSVAPDADKFAAAVCTLLQDPETWDRHRRLALQALEKDGRDPDPLRVTWDKMIDIALAGRRNPMAASV